MPEFVSTILNYLKPGLSVYFATTAASLFLLVASQDSIDWLGMPDGYRTYAGTALVIGFPLLFFTILAKADAGLFFKLLILNIGNSLLSRSLRKEFDQLSFPERCLIAHVVASHKSYFVFPPDHGIIQSLVDKNWAHHPAGMNSNMFEFDGSKWRKIDQHLRAYVRQSRNGNTDEEKAIVPMIEYGLNKGRLSKGRF